MPLILGLDTETQGLDATKDRVTEWGLVLWDSETKQPVRISGFLVKVPGGVSSEIEKLTGITNSLLETYGVEPAQALKAVLAMAEKADFICAHNAEFDKGFYEAEYKRANIVPYTRPWIDTRVDLPVEAYQRGKSASLKYLACDHNFTYDAHRAVSDVLAMLRLVGMYDVNTIIKRAQTPNIFVRAVIDYDNRLLAKERGYYWRPEAKLWVKPLKADLVDEEKQKAPFPVVVMAGDVK